MSNTYNIAEWDKRREACLSAVRARHAEEHREYAAAVNSAVVWLVVSFVAQAAYVVVWMMR